MPQLLLACAPPEVPLNSIGSGLNPGEMGIGALLATPALIKIVAKAVGTTIQGLNVFIVTPPRASYPYLVKSVVVKPLLWVESSSVSFPDLFSSRPNTSVLNSQPFAEASVPIFQLSLL